GIPLLEGLLIKDYPTLRKVAGFVLANPSQGTGASPAPAPMVPPSPSLAPRPAPPSPAKPTAVPAPSPAQPQLRPATSAQILRRAPMVRPAPLPEQRNDLRTGVVLLVGEVDNTLAEAFVAAGYRTTTQRGQP